MKKLDSRCELRGDDDDQGSILGTSRWRSRQKGVGGGEQHNVLLPCE